MIEDKHIIRMIEKSVFCEHGFPCDKCCWPFQGAKLPTGHGQLRVDPTILGVHVISYRYFISDYVPSHQQVNHHCNAPNCWNPNHLYVGTKQDNMNDKRHKEGKTIITEDLYLEIQGAYYNTDMTMREVAAFYNISVSHTNEIIHGRRSSRER